MDETHQKLNIWRQYDAKRRKRTIYYVIVLLIQLLFTLMWYIPFLF